MLKTKRKLLATLVAFTLVMTSIMPNVALALESVEDTQPTTKITETEPAASTKSTKKPESSKPKETKETTKATEETTKTTSESTKATSETTKKPVESTTKATEASKEETSTTTTVESSKKTEESKVSESTPKESTETSAETASTTETSETKETKETTETTVETSESSSNTVPSESTTEESKPSESTTEETIPTESGEVTESSDPTESTEPTEETEPSESSSETSEPEETDFNQSITVDGIKITVTADKSVFPNGAELTAKKVENNKINKEDNVVASMTFDIAIMLNGEEIEPDTTKGNVKVTFFDERFEDKNLDAAIYHTSDDKKTEELKIKNVEGGAEVTTDGFSLYTVEFTYEDMKYTLTGYASAPLKTILEKVGLTGEVTEVKISNEKLVRYENGYIFAVKAFSTKEWMKVTINDITYLITLTDSPDSPEDATAGTDAYAVFYDSGKLVFQKGTDAIGAYGAVVNSWLIPANWDDSSTTDTVELAPWVNNTSITDVIFIDNIKGITNLGSYFKGLTNLTNLANANRIDTSAVTNAGSMFYECTSLESVNLDGWNLSSASNLGSFLSSAFSGANNLKTISMKNWDNLPADCSNVFGIYCYLSGSGITIDVTGWDTSTVTNMSGLFASNAITNIVGYKNFDMSNVTTVSQMFQGAQLATIDCSNWNTSNITTFGSGTFCGSSVNKTLILDNCDLRNANFSGGGFYPIETISMKNAKIGNTFAGSSGFGRGAGAAGTLKTIDVTNMDLSGCTSLSTFFASFGNNVTIIGLDTLNTNTVTDFSYLFQSSLINNSIDLSNFTFKSGDNINYMFDSVAGVTTIKLPASISNVDFSTAKLPGNWKNTSTNEIVKGTEITSGGTYTRYFNPDIAEVGANAYAVLYSDGTLIFQNTNEAISGHGSIDTSWVVDNSNHPWTASPYNTQVTNVIFDKPLLGRTSAWNMFSGCSNLVTITNLNKLDTSSITDMDSMFSGCSSLTTLDLSNFDTTSSNYFNNMFKNCSSLTSVDISSFSNLNNKTTDAIFVGCTNLTSVKFGADWRFSNTNWYTAAIKWKNTSTNNVYTSKELANSWSSSLAGTYTREAIGDDAYVSFDAYAILYSDGTLVFQKGDTADSTYGTVVQTWAVDESSHPWTNNTYKSQVKQVIFKDKLVGRTSCASMFAECNNLSSITNFANLDMHSVTSTNSMFWNVVSINTIDFTGMDLSHITDCGWMFGVYGSEDTKLTKILGVQYLINSNNTNTVQTMFQNRTVLTTIEGTETWDLSNVTNTSWMFNNCYALSNLNTTNWNMSNVTNTSSMFAQCDALTSLNTTNWNMSNNTNMNCMFYDSNSLKTIDVSNWNISSKMTNTSWAFTRTKVTSLDMSNWNMSNVTDTYYMLGGCNDLTSIKLGANWKFATDTSSGTFGYNPTFKNSSNEYVQMSDIYSWDSSKAGTYIICASAGVNAYALLYDDGYLVLQKGNTPDINHGELITSWSVGTYSHDWTSSYNNSIKFVDFKDIIIGRTSTDAMFQNCYFLQAVFNAQNLDMSQVTDMSYMFNACRTLSEIEGIEQWKPSNCQYFHYAFGTYNAEGTKLTEIDMSNWQINEARHLYRMFENCSKLKVIDLSGFNCVSGYACDAMVNGCSNLERIILPDSITEYGTHDGSYIGLRSSSNTWLKDNNTLYNYSETISGGTYDKLLKVITFKKDTNVENDVKFYLTPNNSKIDIPNELLTLPNNAAGESFAGWFDADEVQYTNTQITKNTPEILYAKFEHEPQTAVYGDDLYQLLYLDSNNNYIIVYQKGNTPSSEYGTFQRSSLVAAKDANYNYSWLDPDYVLQLDYFYDEGSNIPNITNATKVIFRDRLTNLPEAAVKFSSNYVKKYSHLDYIDMSNATSLSFISKTNVSGCAGMAQWNTSHFTSLKYAFNSTNFDNCDIPNLSNWDVSNVTDMSYTFYQSVGEPKGISGWNTSNVTNMSHLFGDAKLYTTDCVKDWDVSNVTDFSYAFTQSGSHVNGVNLTNATLNWNMKSAQNMSGMFQGCYKLTNIKFIPFTATATTNNMSNIFNNCGRLSDISELAKWDVSNVTNMSYAFANTNISNVNALNNWNVSNVTNMSYMFQGKALADISGLSNWQTSSLTDMSYMFYNQKYITDLSGISNFDVSHVTTMSNTFYGLTNLSSLEPLSGWTTSSLTNLSNTFRYTYGLKSLKGLENWDVSHVTTMDSMHYCEVYDNPLLKDVTAISNWHATSLTNYSSMFYGNNLITEVDLSNWDLSGTRNNSGDAFAFCYSLIKISLPASFTTAYPSSYGTTYDSNKPIFNTNWIYTTDDSIVNLQDTMGSWSADKAGTYVKNYYLTLYPMGGTVEPTKIERNINQAVDELPTPTRDGYNFLGWYDSEGNLITSIAAGEYVASLFAQWQSKGTYTLIIDPNINGYDPYVVELKLDEKFRLDPTLLNIPDTFEFSHFSERKSGDGEVYNKNQVVVGLTELGETVTIYAQWITHDPIPVKVHFVNILTGAKSSNTIEVRLNEYLNPDQFRVLAGKNRIQYASYRSDLDLVHFVENEEEINYSYSSSDITKFNQDGTDSGETYTFNYFYLKSEYAQAIDSGHKWTLEDLNKDIYVYYLPPLRTRIWFNSIQTNVLPVDLKMTINGRTYKSGEYILETGQASTPDSFYYYGQNTTPSWGGSIYLPSVYASMVYQAYDEGIGEYVAEFLKANNATFNYPISLECAQWLGGKHKNFADDWQKLYSNGKYVYFTSPTDIMDISIPLDYLVVLDYGENYQTYGLNDHYYAQNTYAYQTDITLDGRLDKFLKLYGTTSLDKKSPYVIEGWYTAPNGQGRKVFDPNTERNSLTPYWDLTDCPVVSYTDKLSEVNNFNTNGWNANQNNEYITLYANYLPRSQYNQTAEAETLVKVIVHDSHYSNSEITHSRTTVSCPVPIKEIYFDVGGYWKRTSYDGEITYSNFFTKSGEYFYEKDPIAFEDFIFGGWFTEPNGQGTEVTEDTIIETAGEYHVYAYWKKPTEKINFSLETDGIHPNEVEIKFGNSAYSGYYTVTSTSAFILGAEKVEGYMIPYALTNESYNFVGWFDSNGHKLEVGDDFVDGTTYYAKWEDDIISIDGIDYNFMFVFSNGKTKMTLPNSYTEQLSYKLRFELNHTDDILNENAIKIYVPNDYLIDTSAIPRYYNISDSQIYGYDSYGNLEYKFGIDKYYYMISNYKTINGSASVETIKRNLPINDSSYLRFKDSDGNYYSPRHDTTAKIYKSEYPVILEIDKDLDGTPEVVKYKYLYIESVPIAGSGISNYDNIAVHGEVSQYWNPDWGEEPVDAGDYIYVNWTLSNYGQRSDGTTDWSNVYSNQDMYFFANTKLPITCAGEKVLDHLDTYKGVDYEFSMSVLTKIGSPNTQEQHSENNSIIMRYPKSQFSYDAQMGEITQPFNILVAPRSAYANGDFYDDTVIKTGKVIWSWAEGSTTTNGRDFWANMGRFNYGFVSSANANNIKATQRQYAILDQKQEFDWYSLYAQRKINGSDSFSVSVKPGDFSYASGASDNCFMWQPTTGRTPLSTYDYCITGVKAVVYNGYSEKLNDGFDPNVPIYVGDIKDVDRNKDLDIYVMYRGANTWTKLESDLDWSTPSNMGSYNDGHVNVSFNRGYSTSFDDEQWEYGEPGDGIYDTKVVGVKIGGQFETGSNYQVIIIVPTIRLFPNYTIQDKVKMDFNQDVKSAITQNDFTIDGYKSNASFRKGEWGSGTITDLGLTTWYLTSDVTDLDLNNRIAILNQNAGYMDNLQEGDAKVVFEVMNTAQNNTYYKPITSGDYYVLLPENTSFRFGEACFAGTSYANSGMFTTTAVNSSYYGDMNYASSGGLTPDECSVETIENWENSGRTMVIYHVKGLDEHYTQKYLSKVNGLFFIVYLHRENEDMYGIAGDIASLFIDKSGTFYANRRTKYENTNEMVHEYFSNLNSQNAAKERSMAYAYQDFEFYTIKYSDISGTENFAHQDGFNQYVANSSNKYTNSVSVFPGENYTYKVLWAQSGKKTITDGSGQSQEIDNETNDTIIYTRLDGVGVFKEVSAPNIVGKVYLDEEHLTFENITVTPTIWYCKDPNFASITDFEHYDLSTIVLDAEHGWYTSANLDSDAKVYGMAFDYSKDSQGRDVYLAGDKFIGITIYQQNLEKATQTFTSESRVKITNFNKSDYSGLNTVNVAIPDLKIDVVSNPASGTATDPTAVHYEQDLVYTWTVHNRENRTINDVIVSFKVPNATTCTLDKIKVGVQSINESVSIKDATLENGIVTLTIKTLNANSDFVITENTYVSTGENGIMITNQGFINGYNGIVPTDTQKDAYKSDITYHITLTMPEPTGIVLNVMPYALIFGAICVTFFVSKKTLKRKEEEE